MRRKIIRGGEWYGPLKTLGLARFSPNFTGLAVSFFSGYVRLAVSIFFKAKKVVKYRFFYFFTKLDDITTSQNLNVLSSHLKHFKVSISQLKESKCLGLAKKNANLVVSQILSFTIRHPYNQKPLFAFISVRILLKQLDYSLSISMRGQLMRPKASQNLRANNLIVNQSTVPTPLRHKILVA